MLFESILTGCFPVKTVWLRGIFKVERLPASPYLRNAEMHPPPSASVGPGRTCPSAVSSACNWPFSFFLVHKAIGNSQQCVDLMKDSVLIGNLITLQGYSSHTAALSLSVFFSCVNSIWPDFARSPNYLVNFCYGRIDVLTVTFSG